LPKFKKPQRSNDEPSVIFTGPRRREGSAPEPDGTISEAEVLISGIKKFPTAEECRRSGKQAPPNYFLHLADQPSTSSDIEMLPLKRQATLSNEAPTVIVPALKEFKRQSIRGLPAQFNIISKLPT